MTQEQLQISFKIMEAIGLCRHPFDQWNSWSVEDGNDCDSGITCKLCGEDISGERIPDYCNSLDAMHEIEIPYIAMNSALSGRYTNLLKHGIFASAMERAEAFLKVISEPHSFDFNSD